MESAGSKNQPPRLEKPLRITEQVWPEGTRPVASVFCITYNHERFVRDAIESFLMQQTTFPVEIFVHDDASIDGTAQIIKGYAAKYPQLFRAEVQQENQMSKFGFAHFFQLLRKQPGEFVALCEGDDFWLDENKLQRQVDILACNPHLSGCCHWAAGGSEKSEVSEQSRIQPQKRFLGVEDLLKQNPVATSALVCRLPKKYVVLDRLLDLPMGDWPLALELAIGGNLYCIQENLSCYRQHGTSLWQNEPRWLQLAGCCRFLASAMNVVPPRFESIAAANYNIYFESMVIALVETLRSESTSSINLNHLTSEVVSGIKRHKIEVRDSQGLSEMIERALKRADSSAGNNHAVSISTSLRCWFDNARRCFKVKNQNTITRSRSEMANLGCGGTYHSAWDNYDHCPLSPEVRTVDLRKNLPIKSESYAVVYSSHTLEHIPRNEVPQLLAEIYRILRPGGIFRIAVPDLEAIARGYILALERCASGVSGAVAEHEWMTIEMLDQMIRCFPGGFMGRLWRSRPLPARSLIEQRVGKEAGKFLDAIDAKIASGDQCLAPDEVFAVVSPDEAQEKNFRKTGEVHRWMYDRFSLARLLSQAGFHDPIVRGALDSRIPEFASYNLDTDENGAVRKPDSLFMEAVKPNV